MNLVPCMGGFCASRESCANYYSDADLRPAERLCGEVEEVERLVCGQRQMDGSQVSGMWSLLLRPDHGNTVPQAV